jgi:hypothetical protein
VSVAAVATLLDGVHALNTNRTPPPLPFLLSSKL